tara:strand:- start:3891 stop:4316 length:426 start_codon:yes stop_codon:yes gene_type:complete
MVEELKTPPPCPHCKRPYKKIESSQRARSNVGTGHEKQVARSLGDMGPACEKIYQRLKDDRLLWLEGRGLFDGWVSRDSLNGELNGGDGARRARQLRDEFGLPIEIEMRDGDSFKSRQAWYRLAVTKPVHDKPTYGETTLW